MTAHLEHEFSLDPTRAAADLRGPEDALWPVNAYSDADELNDLLEAAQNSGLITARRGARLFVYPLSIREPDPLLALSPPVGPTLLGGELHLEQDEEEDAVSFTLRLCAEAVGHANRLLAAVGDLDHARAVRPSAGGPVRRPDFPNRGPHAGGPTADAPRGKGGTKRAGPTSRVQDGSPAAFEGPLPEPDDTRVGSASPGARHAPESSDRGQRVQVDPAIGGDGGEALLLAEACAIYERAGQGAVEEWARRPDVLPSIRWGRCGPCETQTPHVGHTCSVCGTTKRVSR